MLENHASRDFFMLLRWKMLSGFGRKIPHFEPIFRGSSHESSHEISSDKTHTLALNRAELLAGTSIL